MTTKELRELSIQALQEKKPILIREKIELFLKKKNRMLKTPHQIEKVKRTIARINTILTEKMKP